MTVVRSADRSATAGLVVLGLAPIAVFLWVAVRRLGYPYELEWMEGGSLELVKRVSEGMGLYAAPSVHFVPWPYTPLYYWVTGGVAKVIGVSFLPLRLVSLSASIAVLGLIAVIVTKETRDRAAGVVAAGVYAGTYAASGSWMDIGRVDSLFLALTLWGVLRARSSESIAAGAVTGAAFFLAFFTKQDALVVAGPVLVWMVVTRRRAGIAAVGVLIAAVVVSTLVLDAATHGWYRYSVFEELTGQGFVHSVLHSFWTKDLLRRLPYLLGGVAVAVSVALAARVRRWVLRSPETTVTRRSIASGGIGYVVAAATGLLLASYVGRAHSGGWLDNLMPVYAGASIVAGVVVGAARSWRWSGGAGATPSWTRVLLTTVAIVGVGAQLYRLHYSPSAQIPTAADRATGAAFIAELRALPPGGVLVADHPEYADFAGRATYAHREAWGDVLRSSSAGASEVLTESLRATLARPGISAVILDNFGDEAGIASVLREHYHLEPTPAVTGSAFFPVTDLRRRPTLVFLRDSGS
jgi:hypothetical protein